MTSPTATFKVLDGDPRQRLPRITDEEIAANLEQVRRHPGPWCEVATFGSKSSASNRATRLRRSGLYDDLEITSRVNTVVARTKE